MSVPIGFDCNGKELFLGDFLKIADYPKLSSYQRKYWKDELIRDIILVVDNIGKTDQHRSVHLKVVKGQEHIDKKHWTNRKGQDFVWTFEKGNHIKAFEKIEPEKIYTILPDGTWGYVEELPF